MMKPSMLSVFALLFVTQISYSQSCPVAPSGIGGGYLNTMKERAPEWEHSPVFAAVVRDIEDRTTRGTTSIQAALQNTENRTRIDDVIDHGTALHLAAGHCRANLVNVLLDAGANPNLTIEGNDLEYYNGMTPLHLAAFNGCTETIDAFLDHRVISDTPDRAGNTPPMELLVGLTRRMNAPFDPNTDSAFNTAVQHLEHFLRLGANKETVNCSERGLLELAIETANDAIFNTVVAQDVSPAQDDPSWNLLSHAINFNNAAAVEYFLEGTTLDQINHRTDKNGYYGPGYLHYATDNLNRPASVRIVTLLLEKGADPFTPRYRQNYEIYSKTVRRPKNVREDILYDMQRDFMMTQSIPHVIEVLRILSQGHENNDAFLAYAKALLPIASREHSNVLFSSGYDFLKKVIEAFEEKK